MGILKYFNKIRWGDYFINPLNLSTKQEDPRNIRILNVESGQNGRFFHIELSHPVINPEKACEVLRYHFPNIKIEFNHYTKEQGHAEDFSWIRVQDKNDLEAYRVLVDSTNSFIDLEKETPYKKGIFSMKLEQMVNDS